MCGAQAKKYFVFLKRHSAVLKSFSFILLLRVVERLTGFVVMFVLFRMLTKEQVSEYSYIQTVLSICAIFAIQEFQNTVSQSVSRGFLGVYRQASLIALRWSLLGSLFLFGFAAWYGIAGQLRLAYGFVIAAVIFPMFHGLSHWKGLYLGEKNFSGFALAESTNSLIKVMFIIIVFLSYLTSFSKIDLKSTESWMKPVESQQALLIIIFIYLAVPAAQNLRQSVRCFRRVSKNAPVENGALAYGLHANWFSAVGTVASNLDRVLIFTFLSSPLLAVFVAAEKFAEVLQSIVQDLGATLAPKFAVMSGYTRSLNSKLKLFSFGMGVLIMLFTILALPKLLLLVFGESYRESIIYAQLLMGGVALNNLTTLQFRFIRSRLDVINFRKILVSGSVCKIVISAMLIPIFGLNGAIASVLIHRAILFVIVNNIMRKSYLNYELELQSKANDVAKV